MAVPKPAPRLICQKREKITSLPLYYEGFLWKKAASNKEFKEYWAELRGTTIFFYSDTKDTTHAEKLELQNLKSFAGVSVGEGRSPLRGFEVGLANEEVQLKTESPEAREEWNGFIFTVTKLEVPKSVALLPGQILRLQEVLEREVERRASLQVLQRSVEEYDDVQSSMPQCFYNVSRQQAMEMLEQHPCYGNLILRPGSDGRFYSVTIRQETEKGISIRHFKVLNTGGHFTIELDDPVTLPSLHAVVDHFVRETKGDLKPFIQDYARKIDVSAVNLENRNPKKKLIPRAMVTPTRRTSDPGQRKDPANECCETKYINGDDNTPPTRTVPIPAPRSRHKEENAGKDIIQEELLHKLMRRRARVEETHN
ncbi:signal-transducing adaptor protein 1 [Latimeria chalumnae]|uniref:signal-transducing adaptor protein 1 n=1 Tax=Latimeria chalumnae TaxID=7897 RepID=UPI0006D92FE7|nr:PREDICTED: signal-transducing adaptor protein 1 isoform X2 [Latimeria chalumnae]|eukprot:XP_014345389.1 PREDICTED: signal-transducing adaptor protein 1 isoform X2 [Latimeria chalumnae]